MSDSTIPVQNPATSDSFLDAEALLVSSINVKRERIQMAGASALEIARIENAAPGASDYGLVVRQVGLAAAGTLSDTTTNPTTLIVAAAAEVFNGTSWDRARSATADALAATGLTAVGQMVFNGTTWDRRRTATADALATTGIAAAATLIYNGATFDRQRGNLDASLLASTARTATTNSPDQTLYAAGRGVLLFLNVTANPGAAETLSLKVQAKDSISGSYVDVADAGVVLTAANGIKALMVYPGIIAADFVAASGVAKGMPLSRVWRAVVTHSAAGSWTYSLSASVLV